MNGETYMTSCIEIASERALAMTHKLRVFARSVLCDEAIALLRQVLRLLREERSQ
jgi:hypothetical protein